MHFIITGANVIYLHLAGLFYASLLASADGLTNGNISFITNHVYVQESLYADATFQLQREAGNSGLVFLTCKVKFIAEFYHL